VGRPLWVRKRNRGEVGSKTSASLLTGRCEEPKDDYPDRNKEDKKDRRARKSEELYGVLMRDYLQGSLREKKRKNPQKSRSCAAREERIKLEIPILGGRSLCGLDPEVGEKKILFEGIALRSCKKQGGRQGRQR